MSEYISNTKKNLKRITVTKISRTIILHDNNSEKLLTNKKYTHNHPIMSILVCFKRIYWYSKIHMNFFKLISTFLNCFKILKNEWNVTSFYNKIHTQELSRWSDQLFRGYSDEFFSKTFLDVWKSEKNKTYLEKLTSILLKNQFCSIALTFSQFVKKNTLYFFQFLKEIFIF